MTENPEVNTTSNEEAAKKDTFGKFVEHETRAFEESLKAIDALLPEGFKEHAKVAGKEFAAGFRVLLDVAAETIDKAAKDIDERMKAKRAEYAAEEGERPSTTGPTKVKVQVE
ncbi:MAG: hypothetical protein UZ15_CFX003001465 [Chloroflexi bacterium OLB15]|nr:MAG: hypothetical protein UZ15_CFX003001465 [Chloroflexi bacterium OLB15]